jgi:hypothetical protein
MYRRRKAPDNYNVSYYYWNYTPKSFNQFKREKWILIHFVEKNVLRIWRFIKTIMRDVYFIQRLLNTEWRNRYSKKKKYRNTPYYIMRTRTSNETKRTVVIKNDALLSRVIRNNFKIYEEMDRKQNHASWFFRMYKHNLIVMLDYIEELRGLLNMILRRNRTTIKHPH